jgi:hypothetical protein
MVVGLFRLHFYEGRTSKYLNYLKHYVGDARMVVDIGCGPERREKKMPILSGGLLDVYSKSLKRCLGFIDMMLFFQLEL